MKRTVLLLLLLAAALLPGCEHATASPTGGSPLWTDQDAIARIDALQTGIDRQTTTLESIQSDLTALRSEVAALKPAAPVSTGSELAKVEPDPAATKKAEAAPDFPPLPPGATLVSSRVLPVSSTTTVVQSDRPSVTPDSDSPPQPRTVPSGETNCPDGVCRVRTVSVATPTSSVQRVQQWVPVASRRDVRLSRRR